MRALCLILATAAAFAPARVPVLRQRASGGALRATSEEEGDCLDRRSALFQGASAAVLVLAPELAAAETKAEKKAAEAEKKAAKKAAEAEKKAAKKEADAQKKAEKAEKDSAAKAAKAEKAAAAKAAAAEKSEAEKAERAAKAAASKEKQAQLAAERAAKAAEAKAQLAISEEDFNRVVNDQAAYRAKIAALKGGGEAFRN